MREEERKRNRMLKMGNLFPSSSINACTCLARRPFGFFGKVIAPFPLFTGMHLSSPYYLCTSIHCLPACIKSYCHEEGRSLQATPCSCPWLQPKRNLLKASDITVYSFWQYRWYWFHKADFSPANWRFVANEEAENYRQPVPWLVQTWHQQALGNEVALNCHPY